MTPEEEFNKWFCDTLSSKHRAHVVEAARLAYLAACEATASRCAKICSTYADPTDGEYSAADTNLVADGCAEAIRHEFGL